MLDSITIRNKLDSIRGYLNEMEPLIANDNNVIRGDVRLLRSIERIFQLIVDAAIDINTSIIGSMELEGPDDYAGTFGIVSRSGSLPADFAIKISKSVGLRNGIVHKYEKKSIDRMLDDIRNNISDYVEYIKHINAFLERDEQTRK